MELAGPLALSDQAEGERWYMLVVTALMRRLNLEATGIILRDTVTASVRRGVLENPQMAAVLPGPTSGRKMIGCQDATRGIGREGFSRRMAVEDVTDLLKERN